MTSLSHKSSSSPKQLDSFTHVRTSGECVKNKYFYWPKESFIIKLAGLAELLMKALMECRIQNESFAKIIKAIQFSTEVQNPVIATTIIFVPLFNTGSASVSCRPVLRSAVLATWRNLKPLFAAPWVWRGCLPWESPGYRTNLPISRTVSRIQRKFLKCEFWPLLWPILGNIFEIFDVFLWLN